MMQTERKWLSWEETLYHSLVSKVLFLLGCIENQTYALTSCQFSLLSTQCNLKTFTLNLFFHPLVSQATTIPGEEKDSFALLFATHYLFSYIFSLKRVDREQFVIVTEISSISLPKYFPTASLFSSIKWLIQFTCQVNDSPNSFCGPITEGIDSNIDLEWVEESSQKEGERNAWLNWRT